MCLLSFRKGTVLASQGRCTGRSLPALMSHISVCRRRLLYIDTAPSINPQLH